MTKIHSKEAKEWYVLYKKDGEWIKFLQKKISGWNAEMIAEFQEKEYSRRCKVVHYTEVDKEEDDES